MEHAWRGWATSITPLNQAQKNGLQVWTCRPPRKLKVYKSNNLNDILTRGLPHILTISTRYIRGVSSARFNLRGLVLTTTKTRRLKPAPLQFTGEKIQSKGRIRRSRVFEAFPCQPHRGFSQAISSRPKIFIASFSESAGFEHFRCKLILCPSLGHAKTIL